MKRKTSTHRLTIALVMLLLVACIPASAEKIRVLFIGNSLTHSNNLHEVFAGLSQSAGLDLQVGIAAPDSMSCPAHAKSATTLNEIAQGWSFVVVQEHLDLLSRKDQRAEFSYPAIRILNSIIRKTGATTVILMPWAADGGLTGSGFDGFLAMQKELELGSLEIGYEKKQ